MERTILRGDIYYADLNPVVGSEQGGVRPALVIQNDTGNKHSPTIIEAAITSKAKTKLPTHVHLSGIPSLEKNSIVLLEQIRTVDKQRLNDYIDTLNDVLMRQINHALAISIGLNSPINQPLIICLCHSCAQQFYNSPDHIIKRTDLNQSVKETCVFCNIRQGYDFEIRTKNR